MPKDPLPASSPGKMPTNDVDIGHVAPSFPDEELWNTLVLRAEYRMSLRLGDYDALFPDEPNSEKGRMARLQALGLFYWPLDHTKATQAFRGIAAKLAVPATKTPALDAVMGAWEYFWRKILGDADDSQADAKLATMLEARILDSLPPPPADPKNPTLDNFKKIRIPGGYAILKSWMGIFTAINDDPAYPESLGDDQYVLETKYHTANIAMGKIPLVALVEKLDPATMEWKPAKDIWVYFQLLEPEPLPAFDVNRDVNDLQQFNRPPVRKSTIGPPAVGTGVGPDKITAAEENPTSGSTKPDASDPQKRNAHKDRGGLRGNGTLSDATDVANVVFSTTSTPGFNAAHAPARTTVPDLYLLAEKATPQGVSHKHAVRAKTNDKGESGVIFTPSRCGGDTYKIRAYVGPTTPASPKPFETNGTPVRAIRVDTGTMVVWRNLRISRYVKMPSTAVNAALIAEVNTPTYNVADQNAYLRGADIIDSGGTNVGLEDMNMSLRLRAGYSTTVGLGQPFDSLPVNFARAFLELEFDAGAAPEVMTDADWQAARKTALADGIARAAALGVAIDTPLLMFMEPGAPALTANDAFTLVPMRTADSYNAASAVALPTIDPTGSGTALEVAHVQNFWQQVLVVGVVRSFARNGYMPGLCLIQAAFGTSWSIYGDADRSSGSSFEYRGGVLYRGKALYINTTAVQAGAHLGYDTTSNGCHELGHVLLRLHGPGNDVNNTQGGGASIPAHDPINGSICVMSYKSCEGNYCAKCLFAFRGWKGLP